MPSIAGLGAKFLTSARTGRLVFGLAILGRDAARALLIHQWFPQREIILVNSLSNGLYGIIVGGGLIATPFVLSAFDDDWRAVFYIFAGLFGVLTVSWMLLGKERVPHKEVRKLGTLGNRCLTPSSNPYGPLAGSIRIHGLDAGIGSVP